MNLKRFETRINLYMVFAMIVTIIINYMIAPGIIFWISAIASILNLWLTSKMNKWFIIPDLIWVVAMLYIAYTNMFLYDGLQYTYYFIIGFVQYYTWSKHTSSENGQLEVITLSKKTRSLIPLLIIILIPILGYLEVLLTTNGIGVASLDALNSSLALTGAFLISRRYFEAQILFLISNIVSVILYSVRGVPTVALTMLLFAGFTCIALPHWYSRIKR